jgi:hypothetical protein
MIQIRHKLNPINLSTRTNYLASFFKEGFKGFENNFKNTKLPNQNEIDKVAELIIHSMPLPKIMCYERFKDHELVTETANKESFDLLHILFTLYSPESVGLTLNSNFIKINEKHSIPFNFVLKRNNILRLERDLEDENATELEQNVFCMLSNNIKSATIDFCMIESENDFLIYDEIIKS